MTTPECNLDRSRMAWSDEPSTQMSAEDRLALVAVEKVVDEVLDLLASAVVADVMGCRAGMSQGPGPTEA